MRILYFISVLSLFLMLTSCFKEDERVAPHDPGDVKTDTIEMTKDYRYQVYYDLASGEEVSVNLKKIWDLAFDGSEDGWKILLNTSSFMLAAKTGTTDFDAPIDTTGYVWNFDASSGNPDTSAFGDWLAFAGPDSSIVYSSQVYVVDRGYDEVGNLRGLRKVVFQEVTDSTYTLRFANLDGSDDHVFVVKKDPLVNYICFSFDESGQQLSIEPPKDQWDLLFTQYTTLLYTNEGDPYPYLLTGVLSNPNGVLVAQDTLYNFSDINIDVAETMTFSSALDEIGYDWKDVIGDVSSGNVTYVIMEGLNYIIRDVDGFYYKMRFTGFYKKISGEKGYPSFEYQRL